jgi:DNA-binding IclR family transcriptional regulator
MSVTPVAEPVKDRHFVTALARGIQILRCFTHEMPELSAGEIVRMTGLPQPTVWRLCHTLQRSGLLICPGDGRMMALGVPVLALGFAALVRQKLPQIALPYMTSLTERYRLGVSLAVRDGLEMTYLQRTHGDIAFLNDPVGARRPIATAPTGWACIAAYGETERAHVLKSLERHQGAGWPATQKHLRQAVDEYREHGFILSIGVMHEHFNALAVPIRPVDGGPVHGLSVLGLASIWRRERLLQIASELITIARDLSAVQSAT